MPPDRTSTPALIVSCPSPLPTADVIELEKSGDMFRLLYDTKGRFALHKIPESEKGYKLCRVESTGTSAKAVPYVSTHDGRTLRYPDPKIK